MKTNSHEKMYLLPPVLFLLCIVGMVLLRMLWPYYHLLSLPYNLLGILLMIAGLALSMWGSRKFRLIQTNIHTFKEPDKLVAEGLYRYTRNPMYLGFAASLFGVFIVLGAASPLMLFVLFVILTDRWYIQFEERMLLQKFGNDYQKYKSATRRWL